MKTKKLFRVMALTAILAMLTVLSLTGCGNDDTAGNGNGGGTQNPSGGGGNGSTQNPSGGTGWTTVTDSNIGTFPIYSITYGDGMFVAGVGGKMLTSTDGITWIDQTARIEGLPTVIAYGNGIFVAGNSYNTSYKPQMWYSSDGSITWTAVTTYLPFDINADVMAIAYGDGKFVVGGTDGSKTLYSSDGITWAAIPGDVLGIIRLLDVGSIYYQYVDKPWGALAIAYGNGIFVAGGTKGRMAYSSNGITSWIAATTFCTSRIKVIAYGNGKFVAGGENGEMAYSSDGATWTAVADSTFDTNSINAITYGNGKFVAGGFDGKMATSPDGITWTAVADTTF